MIRTKIFVWLSLLYSVFVSILSLIIVFGVYTDLLDLGIIRILIPSISTAILLRYASMYHDFEKFIYRLISSIAILIVTIGLFSVLIRKLFDTLTISGLREVVKTGSIEIQPVVVLPRWWILILYIPAGVLIIIGTAFIRDPEPYPKPSRIADISNSSPFFSFFCMIFGLWAVLFVGIGIQRIIVIAPLFEELLKFGTALLIGSCLFGRSRMARIGIAIVIGSLFGIIEYHTTYPHEPEIMLLFRAIFHMTTTILSVSIYSYFETGHETKFRWASPFLAIFFHFSYNTFAVGSAILMSVIYGDYLIIVTLIYGLLAITLMIIFIVLSIIKHRSIVMIHRPIIYVLQGLVR